MGSQHWLEELHQLSMILPEKSSGLKTRKWSSRAAIVFQARSTRAVRGGLFLLRLPPLLSSGTNRSSSPLGFPVWFLDMLILVFFFFFFVFDSPLYLGFLCDFLSL